MLYSFCNNDVISEDSTLGVISGVVEQASGKDDILLSGIQPMGNLEYSLLCDVFNLEKAAFLKAAPELGDSEPVSLLNPVKLIRVYKYQREDTEINQVGTMDAGIRFCQDGLDPEVHGDQSSMLATGALTIIFPGHHKPPTQLLRPFGEFRIHPLKEIF